MKTLIKITISFFLSLTLMAPAIVNLINFNSDSVLVISLTEEENQTSFQIDLKEKQVESYSYPDFDMLRVNKKRVISPYCVTSLIGYISEIPIPPPEHFV